MNSNDLSYLLARILGKLRLARKVTPSFFSSNPGKVSDREYEQALGLLNSLHPDRGLSSLRPTPATLSDEYDVQIVVAAYNEERNIARCLDSILDSTRTAKILTVVIDDGSTDRTPDILRQYASRPDIEVIHQENRGLSGARNRGLERIRGRYIMFVDSDDTLPPGAVDSLLHAIRTSDADICTGAYNLTDTQFATIDTVKPHPQFHTGYPWGKLYSANLFRNIIFPEYYWFEDTVISALVAPIAKKKSIIDTAVYNYQDNPAGITRSCAGRPKLIDTIYVTLRMLDDRRRLGLEPTEDFYHYLLRQIKVNQTRIFTMEDMALNEAVFTISRRILSEYDPFTVADNNDLKLLEWSLRNNNFHAYIMACV